MRFNRQGTARFSELGGILDGMWSWYMKEALNAMEHTGEVKLYSKEEIAEYLTNLNKKRRNTMDELTMVEGMQFNNVEVLGSFVSSTIGDTIYDVRVTVEFHRTEDKSDEGILQKFDFWITGAEEYNALETFVNELHTVYSDHWGHDYILRITVTSFTKTD